mgnify:CR=1 FL=1
MKHSEETAIKSVRPTAGAGSHRLTELRLWRYWCAVQYFLFGGIVNNHRVPVQKHGICRMNKVFPVAITEGCLKLRYGDSVGDVKGTVVEAHQAF